MGFKRKLLGLGAVLAGAIAIFVAVTRSNVAAASGDLDFKPFGLEGCRAVRGMLGAEDVQIDQATQTAIISSDARRPDYLPDHGQAPNFKNVGIYALSLADDNATPRLFTLVGYPHNSFYPHGISLWTDPATNARRLFVVNHLRKLRGNFLDLIWPDLTNIIDIFDVDLDALTLTHVRSVTDPLMNSPNDVEAVGPDSFYISNDAGSVQQLAKLLEQALGQAWGSVLYWSPATGAKTVVPNLNYPNGLLSYNDNKHLIVAETVGRALSVYKVGKDGDLELEKAIHIPSCIDNLSVDPATNDVYIGSHPDGGTFLAHAFDASRPSPSQGIRVSNPLGDAKVTDIFKSHGSGKVDLAASSVVAVGRDKMVVGSVFGDGVLVCPLPH